MGAGFELSRLPRTFQHAAKVVARPPPTEESNLNTPSHGRRRGTGRGNDIQACRRMCTSAAAAKARLASPNVGASTTGGCLGFKAGMLVPPGIISVARAPTEVAVSGLALLTAAAAGERVSPKSECVSVSDGLLSSCMSNKITQRAKLRWCEPAR